MHPGGPFWARKDAGAWSIPKGELDPEEDPLGAALREFAEELGYPAPQTDPTPLGDVRQRGGKVVTAWAVEGDLDVTSIVSNTITIEWPRGSGRQITFPEVDRAQWFDLPTAREKLLDGSAPSSTPSPKCSTPDRARIPTERRTHGVVRAVESVPAALVDRSGRCTDVLLSECGD